MTAPTMIRRRNAVAPTPEPIKGTLLDITGVEDVGPIVDPTGLYVSLNCIDTDTVTTMCPDGRGSKNFESPTTVDGQRIVVYSGVTCTAFGDWADLTDQLDRVQLANRSKAIERALIQDRFTGNEGGAAATDITPAAAVSPKLGLAMLEGAMADGYAGVGIIHMPRTIASLLLADNLLEFDGEVLQTKLGTPVAAGAGYEVNNGPDGTPSPDGETWIYASGLIRVEAGQRVTPKAELNRDTNNMYGLIEQYYVVSVDCFLAAVRVSIG